MNQPYARVNLGRDSSGRPLVINARTKAMLEEAQRRLGHRLTIVQGSYRAGDGAAASAGTHDGGGVVDLRTWDIPAGSGVERVVRTLRRVGFAAWHRTQAQGFAPHIHAVAIGDRELHPSAAAQVEAYRRGLNGLASQGADDGPQVRVRTWEEVSRPVVSVEDMQDAHDVDPQRPSGLHPHQTRRVQRALGMRLRSGRWGRGTRRKHKRRFPNAGTRPTRYTLGELAGDTFRVGE